MAESERARLEVLGRQLPTRPDTAQVEPRLAPVALGSNRRTHSPATSYFASTARVGASLTPDVQRRCTSGNAVTCASVAPTWWATIDEGLDPCCAASSAAPRTHGEPVLPAASMYCGVARHPVPGGPVAACTPQSCARVAVSENGRRRGPSGGVHHGTGAR